jgi:hypothetical protein
MNVGSPLPDITEEKAGQIAAFGQLQRPEFQTGDLNPHALAGTGF